MVCPFLPDGDWAHLPRVNTQVICSPAGGPPAIKCFLLARWHSCTLELGSARISGCNFSRALD